MELIKIKDSDLSGKGVLGQPEVPGLSAEEMQRKVEEIVREIAIPKINEVIEYIIEKVATHEDIEESVVKAGAVTSVFGRFGNIKASTGDYTAAQVGAAEKFHAEQHKKDGEDPIIPTDINAADRVHTHGNITSDGKIGTASGMVVMTGTGGVMEAKAKNKIGFVLPPETVDITGGFTAQDNKLYIGSNLADFIFVCDEDKTARCHGWATFGIPGTITLSGFDFIDDPDDIKSATAGSRWEFDLERGCLIIRKRSE